MSIVGPRPLVDKNFELYPIHVKATINNVKPGLTGIGSIVFRDEGRLLSELELWYQKHLSFYTDFMLIFLTAWAILVPKSDLAYSVFKDLPKRSDVLS